VDEPIVWNGIGNVLTNLKLAALPLHAVKLISQYRNFKKHLTAPPIRKTPSGSTDEAGVSGPRGIKPHGPSPL